jgi:hypothetical protein
MPEPPTRRDPLRHPFLRAPDAGAAATRSPLVPRQYVDPCLRAAEPLDPIPTIGPPRLIRPKRVGAAGVLMLAHSYGTRLRFFDAVDRARLLLDTDQVRIGDRSLRARLYCWPERDHRVDTRMRLLLAAKVLGVPHPDVPDDERDDTIQRLLAELLDALHGVCDPGGLRTKPTAAAHQRLESAASAVCARLSTTMTGLTTMQVRDLQVQLKAARDILTALAPHLRVPDLWGTLAVLVGERLRADGVELLAEAETARAWAAVFTWLATPSRKMRSIDRDLCRTAALLRPPRSRCGGCQDPGR